MDDLSVLESHLQEQLEDSTLKYERAVSGGIINRAAIFHSKMTMQSYFIKYNPGEVVIFIIKKFIVLKSLFSSVSLFEPSKRHK